MIINFRDSENKNKYFNDLKVNDCFRIVGHRAIYIKCRLVGRDNYYMLELKTGHLFSPTVSQVELVNVIVNIEADKY